MKCLNARFHCFEHFSDFMLKASGLAGRHGITLTVAFHVSSVTVVSGNISILVAFELEDHALSSGGTIL